MPPKVDHMRLCDVLQCAWYFWTTISQIWAFFVTLNRMGMKRRLSLRCAQLRTGAFAVWHV
jgi:hypothetical protein